MHKFTRYALSLWAAGALFTAATFAQDPAAPPPDPVWKGNVGAGLSLTGGNTDTANYSLSFEATRDPKSRNLMRFTGLYLRSDQSDVKTSERLRFTFRDEYTLSDRVFVYGDMGYVRDPFKEIDYLLNPQAGLGWKAYQTDRMTFGLDGGLGVVWERNTFLEDTQSSGSINAGQQFEFQISEGTKFVQNLAALWKMDDFEDSLVHFAVGLATRLTSRTELKVEFIDDYKNVTPSPDVKKNDTAFLTSVIFNF